MLENIRIILRKTNNISRSAYIWNAINAMMSALESPLLLMVIMRTNGLRDAGIFSIAFAAATLLLYVGQYGFRRYQSSDINEKFTFDEYYGSRIITCVVMFFVTAGYCIYGSVYNGYSANKFAVVFLICALKGIQAFSDVIHGRMQQKGRLDVATKCSCVRYIFEMLSFATVLVFTNNLLLSSIVCFAISLVVFFLTSYNAAIDFCALKPSFRWEKMKQMLIEGFPLFASLFLNMYICNAPKYAIDAYLTEEIQALYNFVFMPAFVIQLIAHFIFNPIITSYAELWQEGKIAKLNKLTQKQCILILALTIVAVVIALTIGAPVLGWIFNADLTEYKMELCLVCIGGGLLAYSVFFNTIITIVRLQKTLLYTYGIAALVALLLSKPFVIKFGITGAVLMYVAVIAFLAIMLAIISFTKLRRRKGRSSAE